MPVGHERINAKNPHPNPDITFIRALENKDVNSSNKALKILEALAAQFRPITKSRGYGINSLVEYEWNPVFSGRNWNAGEIIEIVLRRQDGSFAPYKYLLFVMCHELAHIEEMNHSHNFKKVNQAIRVELATLRAANYYGDGFWSQGNRLTVGRTETPFKAEDQPVYVCGGMRKSRGKGKSTSNTNSRSRSPSSTTKARKSRAGGGAKLSSGRQTNIGRVPGTRVKSTKAFSGTGNVLSEDPEQSTFKKQAGSNKAAELRAEAAQARVDAATKKAKQEENRLRKLKKANSSVAVKDEKLETIIIDSSEEEEDELLEEEDNKNFPKIFFGVKYEGDQDSDVEILSHKFEHEEEDDELDFDESEAAYVDADRDNWDDEDDVVINNGNKATTTGSSSKGKKRATTFESEEDDIPRKSFKPSTKKALTSTDTSKSKGKKRLMSVDSASDEESESENFNSKKSLNKSRSSSINSKEEIKNVNSTSSTSSGRKWTANDEERVAPISTARLTRTAPMKYFKSDPSLQEAVEESSKASRRRNYTSSPSPTLSASSSSKLSARIAGTSSKSNLNGNKRNQNQIIEISDSE